jgi:hypothetical protein
VNRSVSRSNCFSRSRRRLIAIACWGAANGFIRCASLLQDGVDADNAIRARLRKLTVRAGVTEKFEAAAFLASLHRSGPRNLNAARPWCANAATSRVIRRLVGRRCSTSRIATRTAGRNGLTSASASSTKASFTNAVQVRCWRTEPPPVASSRTANQDLSEHRACKPSLTSPDARDQAIARALNHRQYTQGDTHAHRHRPSDTQPNDRSTSGLTSLPAHARRLGSNRVLLPRGSLWWRFPELPERPQHGEWLLCCGESRHARASPVE